jgi:electron transfer flavoprotein alpha subunit
VSEIAVRVSEKCTGCEICTYACPFGAIKTVDGRAYINEACRVCRQCIDACPIGAIFIQEEEVVDLNDYSGIMVYAEQRKDELHPVSYELLGKALELAAHLNQPVYAVAIGHDLKKGAEELISRGADKVYVYSHIDLMFFRDDPYSDILAECCIEVKPSIFLIGATNIGRSLGPRVAAKIKTGLTADCTGLDIDPETKLLMQTRPAYGGNIMATIITPNSRPQMATVRYKMFGEAKRVDSPQGEIIFKTVNFEQLNDRIKIIDFEEAKEFVSITEADLIVSGGLGLGEAEGFKLIQELAEALHGAIGASRPTVDEGWIDYRHQVGLSGRTVRPQVYMACGISGSVQHQAGMKTSDIIIAINKDPEAPIFKISSLGVIGDLYEVIPPLVRKIKEGTKSA